MHTISIDYDIARSPDEVFAYLSDFANLRQWRTLEALEVVPPGSIHIGSRLLTKVAGVGRPMRFTNEVTQLDLGQRVFQDRAIDGTFLIQSGWRVEPHNGGSRLHWNTQFQAHGLLAILTPVLRRAIRQGQLADLEKLKQILEQ